MTRTLTSRNFFGGFWGGILGILVTAKLHFFALMFGCLVGVMLGFYYQEIWQIAKNSHLKAVLKLTLSPDSSWVARWQNLLIYDRAKVVKNCATILAACAFVCVVFASAYLIIKTAGIKNAVVEDGGVWAVAFLWSFFGVLLVGEFRFPREPHGDQWNEVHVRNYFTLQVQYQKGAVYFFFREFMFGFLACFIVPVSFVMLLGLCIFMFFVWPLIALFFGILFLGLFMFGFMRGVYRLATKPDHWPCLLVTIVVTSFVALFGHDYLEGKLLAVAALVDGLLAGAGAVIMQLVLHRWMSQRPRLGQFFSRSLGFHINLLRETIRAMKSPADYQLRVRTVWSMATALEERVN